MNGLQQLINQLCPNGVEWKTLGEVCEMQRGTSLTKANSIEGEYPVISGGKEPAFYCNQYNREGETITIAGSGAGAGFVQYWNQKIFVNDAFSMKGSDNLSVRYLYYCLQNLQEQIYATKKGGGVPHVHISDVKGFQIPLPPLAIQSRIVEILDHFTNLTANLTAELALRRKQFEHFREKLLSFDGVEGVEMKKLGEVCVSIKDGMHNLPKSTYEVGEYPIISALNIFNNSIDYNANRFVDKVTFEAENKRTNVSVGDVLLTIVASIGRSAVVKEDKKVLLQRSICVLKPNKTITSGYIKYCLDKDSVQKYMLANAHGAAQAGLYLNQVESIQIPVPPLAVQQSIVEQLDKFTALIQNIENELALRQKQYEYCREKLLSFPSPSL